MFCNHCGVENAGGSQYCSACGGPITLSTGGRRSINTPGQAGTELGLPAGAILANRYRILGLLGMGGMGRVYLAEDQMLETRVAIKVLREVLSSDQGSVKRLIAEARHSMTLAHPNVVRVHNFEDGEIYKFLVMEYVEGGTLADRIAGQGKLIEADARRIAIEICKGLEHAHGQKVIHRDIKPGNVLLGKSGTVKIADFGIARECRDSVSRLTSQVDSGTLLYMSPEQLNGKSNEASDIYSLGVVLYEMLTGEPPFHSGEITYQIREVIPDPPEGTSPALSAIVQKCLEKKPERRFASVGELREELDGTAPAKHKEELLYAELRNAEAKRVRAEEQRVVEGTRRHVKEQRENEERSKQAELEANGGRDEEHRRQKQVRRRLVEHLRAVALLAPAFAATALALALCNGVLPQGFPFWGAYAFASLFGLVFGLVTCADWKGIALVTAVAGPVHQLAVTIFIKSLSPLHSEFAALACAGAVGALLMTAAAAVFRRELRAVTPLLGAVCAGAVGGLPFVGRSEAPFIEGYIAWQVLVGCSVTWFSLRKPLRGSADWGPRRLPIILVAAFSLVLVGVGWAHYTRKNQKAPEVSQIQPGR